MFRVEPAEPLRFVLDYWHSRTGRAQDAAVTGIVRFCFLLEYPVAEFVEQIVDLEQEMKSK